MSHEADYLMETLLEIRLGQSMHTKDRQLCNPINPGTVHFAFGWQMYAAVSSWYNYNTWVEPRKV